MAEFLEWFANENRIDPVLKAGVAHFWFVTIHPFEDGNGRIGRAIADMTLARAEGAAQRFYSMSAQIEVERKEYYLHLERSQRGDTDITTWLEWFLQCLGRAVGRAEEALASILRKAKIWERIPKRPMACGMATHFGWINCCRPSACGHVFHFAASIYSRSYAGSGEVVWKISVLAAFSSLSLCFRCVP